MPVGPEGCAEEVAVKAGDELEGDHLGADRLALAVVGAAAEAPRASMAATMFSVRSSRSGWPCGRTLRWVTLAAVNSMADALGHAATQAPQPMHAAASKAVSAASFGTRIALASGRCRSARRCSRRTG